MVQKIAQEGYLVVTWANWHYQDFVNTWIKHVRDQGITGYIVGAMDDKLLEVRLVVVGGHACKHTRVCVGVVVVGKGRGTT